MVEVNNAEYISLIKCLMIPPIHQFRNIAQRFSTAARENRPQSAGSGANSFEIVRSKQARVNRFVALSILSISYHFNFIQNRRLKAVYYCSL